MRPCQLQALAVSKSLEPALKVEQYRKLQRPPGLPLFLHQAHFLIYHEYVKTTNNTRRDAHDK